MPIDGTMRKLREAQFFLGMLRAREGDTRLDGEEEFGYCLSAFLSAARSVTWVLQKEETDAYRSKGAAMWAAMEREAGMFANAMKEFRNVSEKQGKLPHEMEVVDVSMSSVRVDGGRDGGSIPMYFMHDEHATIGVARYRMVVNGELVSVVDACDRHLRALEAFVKTCE